MHDAVSLWRIGTEVGEFRADDMSGAGAEKYGGRFNSAGKGIHLVYASSNAALTVLETLVHMGTKARAGRANRYLIELSVPENIFKARRILTIHDVTARGCHFWDAIPFSSNAQRVGDEFFRARDALLLQVPSAIIAHAAVPDVNYLINPLHPDFASLLTVRREKFNYDLRLPTSTG